MRPAKQSRMNGFPICEPKVRKTLPEIAREIAARAERVRDHAEVHGGDLGQRPQELPDGRADSREDIHVRQDASSKLFSLALERQVTGHR